MKLLPIALVLTAVLFSASVQAAGNADRHTAKGIPCTVCHGQDMKNPTEPTVETCAQCHNVEALVAKTKDVKPQNPHVSPHYQSNLECQNCHVGHAEPQNFCGQCHSFDYTVK